MSRQEVSTLIQNVRDGIRRLVDYLVNVLHLDDADKNIDVRIGEFCRVVTELSSRTFDSEETCRKNLSLLVDAYLRKAREANRDTIRKVGENIARAIATTVVFDLLRDVLFQDLRLEGAVLLFYCEKTVIQDIINVLVESGDTALVDLVRDCIRVKALLRDLGRALLHLYVFKDVEETASRNTTSLYI